MRGKSKQILVVDGHEDVLISIEKLLEEAGFDTTTAWSAREARLLLKDYRFEVVLVGECLPDGRCEDLFRVAHRHDDRTRLIVLQASSPLIDDGRRFVFSGAFAVASKYEHSTVLSAVERAFLLSARAAKRPGEQVP
jgi:DNA-binding NtrC family response regulator